MSKSERRARIRANLGIEPISHGQVYTFQIAIPDSEQQDFSLERRQLIEESLTQHKTNLIPLIVRRTEAYSEEEEYEVVHGADWCLVARELDIEKLWVWVYNMNDEQAAAAREEMQQLLEFSNPMESAAFSTSTEIDINEGVLNKLEQSYQVIEILKKKIEEVSGIVNKINTLDINQVELARKIENLSKHIESITTSIQASGKGEKIQQDVRSQLDVEQIASMVAREIEASLKNILQEIQPKRTQKSGYNAMTKDTLITLAREKQIKVTTKMTKAKIIEALQEFDKARET